MSNHLGNVLTTITDKKLQQGKAAPNESELDYFTADVASATDYYPGGMGMPGRKVESNSYRYGFNGKENDNEIKGDGIQQDYGMRIYDTRLGRFLSVDPITKKYPELTPYQFASNSPVQNIDIDGLEGGWAGFGQNVPPDQWDGFHKGLQRGHRDGGIIVTAGAIDLLLTKGWLTRILLASQVIGAFEHNQASTPEGRSAQDQRSKQALTDAFFTWSIGKVMGVGFKTTAEIVQLARNRTSFAKSFYTKAGYDNAKTTQHIGGIELKEKVFETTLKKGTELEQWTFLDKDGKPILGDYFTFPGSDPGKLAIPMAHPVLGERVKTVVILKEDTKFLQSTTADVESWFKPGEILKGGGTQLFQTNVQLEIKKIP